MRRREFIKYGLIAMALPIADANKESIKPVLNDYIYSVEGTIKKIRSDKLLAIKLSATVIGYRQLSLKVVDLIYSKSNNKSETMSENGQRVLEMITNPNIFLRTYGVAYASFFGPIFEELLFRFLPAKLAKLEPETFSIEIMFLSSLVFAFYHNIDFENLTIDLKHLPIPQFISGILLWVAYRQFGIEYAIFSHILFNSSLVLPDFIMDFKKKT
jgi:hypothetical protein